MDKNSANALSARQRELLMLRLKRTAVARAGTTALSPIVPADRSAPLPLSWAQQRLWFIDQLDAAAGAAYHMPAGLRMKGRLDRAALRATLDRIVARHENLRTTFVMQGGEPVQRIAPAACGFALEEEDLAGLDEQARGEAVARSMQDVFGAPFDLSAGPLIRGRLVRVAGDEHLLLMNQHHIVSDGWSLGVFVREVAALYTAFSQGQPDPLPPLAIQYADYAVWQRDWLRGDTLQAQIDYWKGALEGAPELLAMPTDRPRPAVQNFAGASIDFTFPAPLCQALRELSARHETTLFMTFLAGWAVLLARMSGQDDIVVGSPIANRQRSEIESLTGFFVNTLALRIRIEGEPSVAALLAQVKAATLGAFAHQDIPFEQVVEAVKPQRSMSHSPLFQNVLTFNNTPSGGGRAELPGLVLSGLEQQHETAKFDLALSVTDAGGAIAGNIVYATDLYDRATVERLMASLQTVMQEMTAGDSRPVTRLALLDAAQRAQLVEQFNDSAVDYPRERLVHRLFEEQAARRPDAIALDGEGGPVSYAELNRRANAVARKLAGAGVKPHDLVAICAERSAAMVAGLLGILKAGAAYVPLDAGQPAERLNFMLADSAPVALLSLGTLPAGLETAAPVIGIGAIAGEEGVFANPEVALEPSSLAYIIYTSGSTGQPKGVMVEHRNILRLCLDNPYARIGEDDCIAHCANPAFDASTWELWGALLNGARVLLVGQDTLLDPARLNTTLLEGRVSALFLTVGLFNDYLDALKPAFARLETLMVGGEAHTPHIVARVLEAPAPRQFCNIYGPTETTTFATAVPITSVAPGAHSIPIGRPIANTQVYILDARMQVVPLGVAGEIYIGGDGVARGYLNQPALTAERFVADPFSSVPGARLYKTGDIGRWLPDGTVDFVGRNDFQVKIRGFRIELGEIEARLARCDGVREALVMVREDHPGDKRLVAYVTGEGGSAAELRAKLTGHLTDYMMPSAFVTLESFPLTANGKIDRKALPEPDQGDLAARAYEAPRGALEEAVAGIWQDLLNVAQAGREDNFFELGGHSLLAVQLMSRIREQMGLEVDLRQLFAHPTLAAFAGQLGGAEASTLGAIVPAPRGGKLPLSWAQQRLWFLDQLDAAAGAAYHVPAGLRLSGTLDRAALKATLDRIVARHENLRTTFVMEDGEPVQRIADEACGFALAERDLRHLAGGEQQSAADLMSVDFFAAPFDLAAGPLIRGELIRLAEDEHILLINQHHIITDGWSRGVLVNEVVSLYTAFTQGHPDPLPPLPIQYADYAAWQRGWLQGAALEAQIDWWKQHLAGAPELIALPADRPRPAVQSYAGDTVSARLPAALTQGLRQLGARHGATLFMTMLAGWSLLMSRLSGQDDVVVGSPVANRQRSEIENLIGFFVNTLALRVHTGGDPDVAALMEQVKATTLGAYAHQDIPFEQVVDALKPQRSMSHSPLFQTMLTVNNNAAAGQAQSLPGLTLAAIGQTIATAQFDLSLSVAEQGEELVLHLEYATDLFDASTITRMLGYFEAVLAGMAADGAGKVHALPLLGEAERHLQLVTFNQSAQDYPLELDFARLFAEQVALHPARIAASCGGEHLSYAELDARASRVARALIAAGAGRDVLVTLVSERNNVLLTMMVAVLKAGAAFLPLDIKHPSARLADIVAMSGSPLMLVSRECSALAGELAALPAVVVEEHWLQGEAPLLATAAGPDDLAYVIFTSGSTGKPKGAMVEQRGMLNHMFGKISTMRIGAADSMAQTASPAFDICVWQFLSALLVGGRTVVLADAVAYDPSRLLQAVEEQGITLLQTVPSMMRSLLDGCASDLTLGALRYMIPTGEALTTKLSQDWFDRFPQIPLMNVYGPAECSDDVTWHPISERPQDGSVTPIGRPTPNNRIYILDRRLQMVPIGVKGEICVDGVGVGRGYLNNPEQTAAAFVSHPLGGEGRFYRTGDLGSYRADGTIDFHGRLDFQVKIRGFRIELGEIEARLAQCEGVKEALVLAGLDARGDQRLVAYVTGTPDGAAALRAQLGVHLADYMIPSAFVMLAAFPLTPNGKIDRKALPAPDMAALATTEYEAPLGAAETAVAAIWQELLGVARAGRRDDFFALGGHSLLAVQLMSRIRQSLDIEVPLRALFAFPVLADFAAQLQDAGKSTMGAIPVADRAGRLPLSWAQQRLWFLDRLDASAGAAYHMPSGLRLKGQLDTAALKATLARIVARHESLRARFVMQDGEPVQQFAEAGEAFALAEHDLSQLDAAARDAETARIAAEVFTAPFDLAAGPLVRWQLLRLSADEHLLLMNQHHIVSDGWSLGVLIKEVCTLYAAFVQGRPDPLPPLAIQYADYAAWQRGWLTGDTLQAQADYWKAHLAGAPELLALPTDRPRPAVQSFAGETYAFSFPAALNARLKQLSARHGTTLFMTLLAGWGALMARLSGQQDVVIGTPVANRQRAEVEGLIGFFVNSLALRIRTADAGTVAGLLEQVRATTLGAYAHQDIPFEQVVEAVRPQRSMGHSPLFQTMVTLNNTPAGGALSLPGLEVSGLEREHATTHFDLSMSLTDGGAELKGSVEYASALFDAATIARMVAAFGCLLEAMAGDDSADVARLALIDEAQARQLVTGFNDTALPYPDGLLVHRAFERRVLAHPDAPALESEQEVMSYTELNEHANRVAHRLLAIGVQPDQRVAICAERSIDMVIGLLGILKAGAAYVPLDTAQPLERLNYLIADSAPVALLQLGALPEGAVIGVPVLALERSAQGESGNPQLELDPSTLAYVIYTSGSTGQPKGVMVEHRNILRLCLDNPYARIRADDCIAHCANPAFDASTWELWGALLNGARVLLVGQDTLLDPARLNQALLQGKVSALFLTVGLFNDYLDALKPAFARLNTLMVGGEAHTPHIVARALEAPAPRQFCNIYGPTETTTFATAVPITSVAPGAHSIPIGRPIANTQVYILDALMQVVPLGVAGEIYIGGDGVARGYLNQPDLTAERFVPDPFSNVPGARLYKTGDIGRWLPDGTVDFVGRNDFQVKIRGFRIELGEIEARLAQCEGVREALVMVREDQPGDKRLVAYLTGEPGEAAALRARLSGHLADYMMPSAFVTLESFPLTANGKIDRKKLPAPGQGDVAARAYEAPYAGLEQDIAAIWQDLLHVAQVGRQDHFFELGGHSLLAVQLMSRIRESMGVEVALRELFAHPTLAEFCARLESAEDSTQGAIMPAPRGGKLPLSWAQQRLWFLDQLDAAAGAAYHMPVGLRLHGALDKAGLKAALDRIVARHENLRTTFVMEDGEPVQRIAVSDCGFALGESDLSQLPGEEREAAIEQACAAVFGAPFHLAAGPLVRGQLVRLAQEEHLLLINQHHIVSDGWSLGILVREVCALYAAFSQGQADPLPPLSIQYADYAVWQRSWLQGAALQAQADYWKRSLAGAPALLALPTDRPRPAQQSYAGATIAHRFPAALVGKLRRLGARHGTTMFMTALAGWSVLMARMSGQHDVVIGTPVANRQRSEVEHLMGFFVNTLALRVRMDEPLTVAGLLAQVKAGTLDAYAHQDIPFEQVVEALSPQRSMAHSPLFQSMLSLNNTPDGGELSLPGLRISGMAQEHTTAQCDISLALTEGGEDMIGNLVYASALFDAPSMARLMQYYEEVLGAMADGEEAMAGELPLLPAAALRQVTQGFNDTAAAFPHEQLLHALFEERAARHPDAPALADGEAVLTYGQLNARANRVAHRLIGMGIEAGQTVALCAGRGLDMVAGLLGILKAGGAYVPLDPAYPADRLAYMVGASAPLAVITETAWTDRLPQDACPVLCLDDGSFDAEPDHDPRRAGLDASSLAYVIFTSGSTGKPKGVMVEHRSVLNLWQALSETAYAGSAGQRIGLNASISFDASVQAIVQLLSGSTVVIVPQDIRADGAALAAWLRAQEIAVFDCTPSQLDLMCNAGLLEDPACRAMTVVVGGEALGAARWQQLQASGMRAYNVYGPTECTVDATLAAIHASGPQPHIGRPLNNTRVYILDARMQPVPVGVAGELYIGGAGVARGYLNEPGLTAERFLDDPFCGVPGARMYRSGDLGRWLADGSIDYLGRNDFQVKIRGFRIELGEIEARLAQCQGVEEAVVLAREDQPGDKRLVAYVTGAPEGVAALRAELALQLADYMLPSAFVMLERMPLTANGKLDRAALPAPDGAAIAARQYVAPEGQGEQAVAAIWQDLLRVPKVGRLDHFFELGGHSLLAVQLVSRLRQALGIEVPLKALFTFPVLADFAAQLELAGASTLSSIPVADRGGRLPLSWAQQRLWFLDQLDAAAGAAYRMPAGLRLSGVLDADAFKATFDRIVARHETLRTTFVRENGEAVQKIAPPDVGFAMQRHDLGHLAGAEQEAAVDRISRAFFGVPFDLAQGPLFRGQLLRLGETEHILLMNQHHIITDGWSRGVLVGEVCTLYSAFTQGLPDPLPPLAIQYADYALWQREWLQGAALQAQLDYWKGHLAGAPELLTLPADYPRPAVQSYQGASLSFPVSPQLKRGLEALSKRHGATLFMTMLTAWGILMSRLSGQADVVIGTSVANRQRAEIENLIGFFVNTLALRVSTQGEPDVAGMLAQVKEATLNAYANQDVPFEQVVEALKPPRSLSHGPLFQTLLTLNNTPPASGERGLGELRLTGIKQTYTTSQFDLSVSLGTEGEGLRGSMEYAVDLFAPATIERFAAYFVAILEAMVADERQSVSRVPLLGQAEYRLLTDGFNQTACGYPHNLLVHQLFEQSAARQPQAQAVVFEGESLTYGELNARANQAAHALVRLGVKPDDRVALCLERGTAMIVAMLAILKAGGAYVPLDPVYPDERLDYMLADSAPVVLLTQKSMAGRLSQDVPRLLIDGAFDTAGEDNPRIEGLDDASLAYVIYTSGSTGQPKGVMLEHRNVLNLVFNQIGMLSLGERDRVLQFASTSFDASVGEIFPILAVGGTLVIRPPHIMAPDAAFERLMREERLSVADIPAAFWHQWVGEIVQQRCAPGPQMRMVVSGGEKAELRHLRSWMEDGASRAVRFMNSYGPTETTVHVTTAAYASLADVPAHELPIGKPIANTRIYLLDAHLQPVPLGVAGEIHVGGAGVARGYLNRPELSAERFIADPFSNVPGARMYKTGDLGRWLPDGSIAYLGRNDFQVKLRGYRIELGEIETRLAQCEGVKEAVVLAREDEAGDKRLVAYLTGTPAGAAELRAELARHLAEHMLPAAFVTLERLPLNPNGKLDRKALPAPDAGSVAARAYAAPEGELEEAIAAVWCDLLRLEQVGRQDHFFELGGHSLLAVHLVARLKRALGVDLALHTIFGAPTLAAFAEAVARHAGPAARSCLVPVRTGGAALPLFLVHPGEGEVAYAHTLARHIDPQVPVYALAASGFMAGETARSSVDEMARCYLAEIRKVQPKGPYRLAGWSAGGTIAYEMANQLIGADERVDFLGLIDTTSDYRGHPSSTPPQQSMAGFLAASLPPATPAAAREALAAMAEGEQADVPAMLRYCQAEGILAADLETEVLARHLAVRHGIAIALVNYALPALAVPLTLFTAQEGMRTDVTAGWKARAGVHLKAVPVPGHHYSMVEAPHAAVLGAALSEALRSDSHRMEVFEEHYYSPRITIQRGKAGVTPLFCVPGAGASITSFTHLSQALGADLPIHGLQPRGLCGLLAPHSSVESAARAYIKAIREHSPGGPVHLLGHSYGGWVATEMARQLEAEGERPASLIVLDSRPPSTGQAERRHYARSEMLERLVQLFDMNLAKPMGLSARDFAPLAPEAQLQLLLARLIDVKILPPRTTLQALGGIVRVFASNLNTDFRPATPYGGPLHLVVAPAQDDSWTGGGREAGAVLARWRDTAPQARLWQAPGNHLTLLSPTHVGALAAWLKPVLLDASEALAGG